MSNPIIKQLCFNHPKQLVYLTTSECDSLRYNGIKIHGRKGIGKKERVRDRQRRKTKTGREGGREETKVRREA